MADLQVHEWEVRRRFNCGGYEKRLRQGELRLHVERSSKPRYGTRHPEGSVSQMIWYIDGSNNPVAKLHRIVAPDGIVQDSGLPDPKAVVVRDTRFLVLTETQGLPIRTYLWASLNALWSQVCKWLDCASVRLGAS